MSPNDTCRLCALSATHCIPVFGDDGNKQNLEHKLRICSPITVKPTDTFPKQVCLDCLIELDKVYDFYQKVKGAQVSLKAVDQSRKRQLSETEEQSSRKKFQFGSTTLSNLSKSFDDSLTQNNDLDDTLKANQSLPPLSVNMSTDTSPETIQNRIPDKPPADIPEKNTPVKKTPKKAIGGRVIGPLRSMRKLKTEPGSPSKSSVSPEVPDQAPPTSVSPTLSKKDDSSSDASMFRCCKFCDRKFLLKDYLQHEALHKGTVLICDQCNKSFFTLLAYNRHIERHQLNKVSMDTDAT